MSSVFAGMIKFQFYTIILEIEFYLKSLYSENKIINVVWI